MCCFLSGVFRSTSYYRKPVQGLQDLQSFRTNGLLANRMELARSGGQISAVLSLALLPGKNLLRRRDEI